MEFQINNLEVSNKFISSMVPAQYEYNLIRDFIKSINSDIQVHFSYEDFYCDINKKEVNIPWKERYSAATMVDEFIKNTFGVIVNSFLMGILHEVGHIQTYDKEEIEERDTIYGMLQMMYDGDAASFNEIYFSIPAEFKATEWGVNYYLSNKNACDNLIQSIGKIL